jgi:hypothetical protein
MYEKVPLHFLDPVFENTPIDLGIETQYCSNYLLLL